MRTLNKNRPGEKLLLLGALSFVLSACAPTLPMLAIGAASYVAQKQLTKSEAPTEPSAKTEAPVKQKGAVSSSGENKSSRKTSTQCRRVNGGTECTLS
jgi:hypothetical protein